MTIAGNGAPLVLIPGMQGRWEWMAPTVDALARTFRVATFSLCGEPGAPQLGSDFDAHLEQVDEAIDALGGQPAILVGVSYGGWIAVRYAARSPRRVRALVVASTPGPRFQPRPQAARWIRYPRLSLPEFVLTSPSRFVPEVREATGGALAAVRFMARHAGRVLTAPMSTARAAARLRLAFAIDFGDTASRIDAPTLVVTGEERLDRVVPVESTREYALHIRGARSARLERTGHMGTLTRPDRFADLVGAFVENIPV
jgi:pimeloyl-ACP methyl ester carboxylesterase